VSTTPAANFATSSPYFVDTGGKFATGVNDTGGKFAAGVNDAGWQIATGIRLQTPESELEGKNLYICFLYNPKVTKENY
jgi:hypothetical protein